MRYRSDIDGLRALAVIPVVLFHLGVQKACGGFIGVDVFFVISGYLITRLIHDEVLSTGHFSFSGFYLRRIRRILPALFVVLFFTSAATLIFYFPEDLKAYAGSLAATSLFAGNIQLWAVTNYFFADGANYPLMHLWSLAVEEQFYLFFPPLLMLLMHRGRNPVPGVLAITLLSFLLSIYWLTDHASATFFLPFTRIWELMIGALLALEFIPPLRQRRLAGLLSLAGVALLLGGCCKLSKNSAFPGASALVPCLGAALLIHTGQSGTAISRLLGWRPIVFVGLISYSLYLWHWPLLALCHYRSIPVASHEAQLVFLAVSAGLATFTWYFVEQPWRHRGSAKTIYLAAACSIAALLVVAAAFFTSQGFPGRFSPETNRLSAFTAYDGEAKFRTNDCFIVDGGTSSLLNLPLCMTATAGKPSYLLAGDSHAADLYLGLLPELPGANILQATGSGCIPVPPPGGSQAPRCRRIMSYLFNDYLPAHPVDTILLSGRWEPWDRKNMLVAVKRIRPYARHIYVIGPTVEYKGSLPRLLAQALDSHDAGLVDRQRDPERFVEDQAFRSALKAEAPDVTYLSITDTLCAGGVHHCKTLTQDGTPYTYDYGHFTVAGATELISTLLAQGQLH